MLPIAAGGLLAVSIYRRDRVPTRRGHLSSMERQTLNEAAATGPHVGTKSLQVVTTRRAKFGTALRGCDHGSTRF